MTLFPIFSPHKCSHAFSGSEQGGGPALQHGFRSHESNPGKIVWSTYSWKYLVREWVTTVPHLNVWMRWCKINKDEKVWHHATKHFGPASFRIRNFLPVGTGKIPGMSFLTIFDAVFLCRSGLKLLRVTYVYDFHFHVMDILHKKKL